jgi:hypothetical protein
MKNIISVLTPTKLSPKTLLTLDTFKKKLSLPHIYLTNKIINTNERNPAYEYRPFPYYIFGRLVCFIIGFFPIYLTYQIVSYVLKLVCFKIIEIDN